MGEPPGFAREPVDHLPDPDRVDARPQINSFWSPPFRVLKAELLHASERIARIAENPLLKREEGPETGFVDRLSGAARSRRCMVDRMLTRCETTVDRGATVDSAAALRDRVSTRGSWHALRRADGGRSDNSAQARSDRCVTYLPSSAKVVTLSGR